MRKDLKKVYNDINNNQDIVKRYNTIEDFEIENGGWAFHNLNHIKNVTFLVEKILKELNYDDYYIDMAKIAALLHDTGALDGKDNHAYRSFVYAKEYFKKNNIEFENINLVLDAIRIHSDGFDTSNIIALALILADKLDIKRNRISESGSKVIGNRQYCHINDILIEINDKILKINFITDGYIDIKELNNYYFTIKVFKAIKSFCEKLNINNEILLDNKIWTID